MRELWITVVLLTAGLAGCIGQGEPIEGITPASEANTSTSDGQDRSGDVGANRSSTGANGANATGDDGETASANGTDANGTDDQDPAPPEPPEPDPVRYNVTGTVEMGYVAAFGASWTGIPQALANGTGQDAVNQTGQTQGQTDAAHCPNATVIVPTSSQRLRAVFHDEPANVSASAPEDPEVPDGPPEVPPEMPNASAVSAGAYTFVITAPDGEQWTVDWAGPDRAEQTPMAWSTNGAVSGAWTIQAQPEGPVVDQTWRVELTLSGAAISPPDVVKAATTC